MRERVTVRGLCWRYCSVDPQSLLPEGEGIGERSFTQGVLVLIQLIDRNCRLPHTEQPPALDDLQQYHLARSSVIGIIGQVRRCLTGVPGLPQYGPAPLQ